MADKKRSFTIQASEIGFTGGDYKSSSPWSAAKKASKRLFQLVEKEEAYKEFKKLETIKFILREKTMGSEKKSYFYEGSVTELKEPIYIKVKAPNSKNADTDGYVKYPITKEIQVATCPQHHFDQMQ